MRAFQSTELPQQIKRVWQLSVPAILTQISSIVMQYIDSAMVGIWGADASAAIGLVATSTWLLGRPLFRSIGRFFRSDCAPCGGQG